MCFSGKDLSCVMLGKFPEGKPMIGMKMECNQLLVNLTHVRMKAKYITHSGRKQNHKYWNENSLIYILGSFNNKLCGVLYSET